MNVSNIVRPSLQFGCVLAIASAFCLDSEGSSTSIHEAAIRAIEAEDLAKLQDLLRDGLSPNSNTHEDTLLTKAVEVGNFDIVWNLLAAGAFPNATPYRNQNRIPIIIAIREDHLEIAKLLVWSGSKLYGGMAIFASIRTSNFQMFEFLMDNGLDPCDPQFGYGWIHAAVAVDSPTLIDYFLERGAKLENTLASHVYYAAASEKPNALRHILSFGLDPNEEGFFGDCPIDSTNNMEIKAILSEAIAADSDYPQRIVRTHARY